MPLSNVYGAQSLIKAGVCTSTTRPSSPYEGQLIYETDTDRILVYTTDWRIVSGAGEDDQTVLGVQIFS